MPVVGTDSQTLGISGDRIRCSRLFGLQEDNGGAIKRSGSHQPGGHNGTQQTGVPRRAPRLMRVVDVVLLQIESPQGSEILFETQRQMRNGGERSIRQLPAAKRRPEEGIWQTCQRI